MAGTSRLPRQESRQRRGQGPVEFQGHSRARKAAARQGSRSSNTPASSPSAIPEFCTCLLRHAGTGAAPAVGFFEAVCEIGASYAKTCFTRRGNESVLPLASERAMRVAAFSREVVWNEAARAAALQPISPKRAACP